MDVGVFRYSSGYFKACHLAAGSCNDGWVYSDSTMFIDGAASVGAEFGGIENVERIEVLKGPQGAHFGRSTYTGAINIVTKDPGDESSGSVNFEAGKYGTQRAGSRCTTQRWG